LINGNYLTILDFSTDLHLLLAVSNKPLLPKISEIAKKINKNFSRLVPMSGSLDYLSK